MELFLAYRNSSLFRWLCDGIILDGEICLAGIPVTRPTDEYVFKDSRKNVSTSTSGPFETRPPTLAM
jgi:hypothetical protein